MVEVHFMYFVKIKSIQVDPNKYIHNTHKQTVGADTWNKNVCIVKPDHYGVLRLHIVYIRFRRQYEVTCELSQS